MIVVEGLIGAGKSTLTQQLSDHYKARPFFEPVASNPYLSFYYQDPKKYALTMQFYLMSNRFDMHQKGIEHIWKTGEPCIFDRSIYGDYVFAKKNWLDGNMSELDLENYDKMRKVMFRFLMVPHITVYLKTDPEICLNRIKNRERVCESDIPIAYLKGLDDLYKELIYDLKRRGSKIITLDWNEFQPLEEVAAVLDPHIIRK